MKRKDFEKMSDGVLDAWWRQYGRPEKAGFYPDIAKSRKACRSEMERRGLNIKRTKEDDEIDRRFTRPKGYDTETGYMFWWGCGGTSKKEREYNRNCYKKEA